MLRTECRSQDLEEEHELERVCCWLCLNRSKVGGRFTHVGCQWWPWPPCRWATLCWKHGRWFVGRFRCSRQRCGSVLTVLSLLPSRNSVCVKTQICHGAAFCRWSMIFTENSLKNKLNNSRRSILNFLLSVGQKQIADSQSASLCWKSQSKPSTTQQTLESWVPHEHEMFALLSD